MKKTSGKKTPSIQQQLETLAPHPYTPFFQQLEALRQPWNHVVRAAIGLLKCPDSPSFCEVAVQEFCYADTVQENGIWNCKDLSDHAKRNAVCIVMSGRVEVVGEESLPKPGKPGTYSSIRPIPYIAMESGGVLGTYEYTGNLFQTPEIHGYKVMSGPVCVQFDHDQFNPFKQAITATGPQANKIRQQAKETGNENLFKEWKETGQNYKLVQALAGSHHKAPHAKILFIEPKETIQIKSEQKAIWEAFRNAVVETAWTQSLASRSRDFKTSRLDLSACAQQPQLRDEMEGVKATLVHLGEVLHGVGAIWTSAPRNMVGYPAIVEFLKRARKVDAEFSEDQLLIRYPLMSLQNQGVLSISDYIHRYDQKANGGFLGDFSEERAEEGKPPQVKDDKRKWSHDDLFSKGPGMANLESIRSYIQTWLKYNLCNEPLCESVFSCSDVISSPNPFKRFQITVRQNLETLPSIRWIEERSIGSQLDLNGVLIIACQHFLRETSCWFSHLMNAGAEIIAIGKDYSTSPEIADRMRRIGITVVELPEWNWSPGKYSEHLTEKAKLAWIIAKKRAISNTYQELLVIDDGGILFKTFIGHDNIGIKKIRGVEQTTSGVTWAEKAGFPVVLVAKCEKKRTWESLLIAESILKRSKEVCPRLGRTVRIGILGTGAIGKALLTKFRASSDFANSPLFFYSSDHGQRLENLSFHRKDSIEELVEASDVVFGCTGFDVLAPIIGDTRLFAGKWFISCSSMDTEFHSLLDLPDPYGKSASRLQRPHNPFSTVIVHTEPNPCFVTNGGFPVNFDRRRDSVPLEKIQFTRGLMHLGLIQARNALNTMVLDCSRFTDHELQKGCGLKGEDIL